MNLSRSYFLIGLIILATFTVINYFGLAQNTEYKILDTFRTQHSPHPEILIAAIDNKSIQEIGRWPWDRTVHADFINSLRNYNPRVVAYDVSFSEKQNDTSDSAFSFAIGQASFPTVLAAQAIFIKGYNEPQGFLTPVVTSVELGHVNVPESNDGIARAFPQSLSTDGQTFLPLSFQVAQTISANIDPYLSNQDSLLVDFSGPAGTIQTISFTDILNRRTDSELLKDKIIFVGATASDLRDYLYAPVEGGILAGVEWHTNVLNNILLNRPIKSAAANHYSLLGLIFGLIILLLPLSMRPLRIAQIYALLAITLPVSSFILWQNKIAFPFFVSFFGISFLFLMRSAYKWYQTEVEKRRLHKTIQNRFSPQVIDAIMRDPKLLRLGGERKEVTVLFSDIRNFTTISESIAPETLSEILHEYFTEMTEEVLAQDGVLDKFIGDAVMAFWGAPIEQQDQADRAVRAALGMLGRLGKLQTKWAAKKYPLVDIGIGIHTGIATVGNMGSEKRFDYTVIGDTVNIASRLEGLNKEYKTHLIVSETTFNKLSIQTNSKSLGETTVKGKTQGINIFEISV